MLYHYTLRAATPISTATRLFQESLPAWRVACGSLTTPLDTPRHSPLLACDEWDFLLLALPGFGVALDLVLRRVLLHL
jgi:hypothetical protein